MGKMLYTFGTWQQLGTLSEINGLLWPDTHWPILPHHGDGGGTLGLLLDKIQVFHHDKLNVPLAPATLLSTIEK